MWIVTAWNTVTTKTDENLFVYVVQPLKGRSYWENREIWEPEVTQLIILLIRFKKKIMHSFFKMLFIPVKRIQDSLGRNPVMLCNLRCRYDRNAVEIQGTGPVQAAGICIFGWCEPGCTASFNFSSTLMKWSLASSAFSVLPCMESFFAKLADSLKSTVLLP